MCVCDLLLSFSEEQMADALIVPHGMLYSTSPAAIN